VSAVALSEPRPDAVAREERLQRFVRLTEWPLALLALALVLVVVDFR
jgi:hypothetical protein